MKKNAYVNVRVNEVSKKQVEKILADIGLTMTTAIELYLKQIEIHNGIPFEVKASVDLNLSKTQELAEAINLTAGVKYPEKFNKIMRLYANGDIDYDIALYAIKREYTRV